MEQKYEGLASLSKKNYPILEEVGNAHPTGNQISTESDDARLENLNQKYLGWVKFIWGFIILCALIMVLALLTT